MHVLMLRQGLALFWVSGAPPGLGYYCLAFVLFAKLCLVESSFLSCSQNTVKMLFQKSCSSCWNPLQEEQDLAS